MRVLVAFPSTASFAQQAALAFHEEGALAAFMTAFAYTNDGVLGRLIAAAPARLRNRIEPQLKRRSVQDLPRSMIEERPFWEVVRTIVDKAGAEAPTVDRIWDHLSHAFARAAGRRLAHGVEAVYGYEYSALEAFRAAEARGVAKILDLPSLNSRQFEQLQRREKKRFPELKSPHEEYFAARFERRQARRDAETCAADVIITNSTVTRASHIAGGANPTRTFAVPYGAPPAIVQLVDRMPAAPLRVVWGGTFSIRKGAHYFMQAWRTLDARSDAIADIYGAVSLPERMLKPAPQGMSFHGSVVRSVLFEAFEAADVLMFPSLSDGFGMVVTEAFACGLPVIATDQAGASDLVRHKHNGLIIPAGDAGAIRAALQWCLNNRDKLAEMRSAALETARNWQWVDYRRALVQAVAVGLTEAGFSPGIGVCRRLGSTAPD